MTDIPAWAREEAIKRLNAEWILRSRECRTRVHFDGDLAATVLARLIAKHEQRREDPDMAMAREAVARVYESQNALTSANDTRNGNRDEWAVTLCALAAIKLHKERKP